MYFVDFDTLETVDVWSWGMCKCNVYFLSLTDKLTAVGICLHWVLVATSYIVDVDRQTGSPGYIGVGGCIVHC